LTKQWWEIQIWAEPALEEMIFWRLQSLQVDGMSSQLQEGRHLFSGYWPQEQLQHLDLVSLSLSLTQDAIAAHLPIPKMEWQLIGNQDWGTRWQEFWHPQPVGDRLLIYPAWLEPPPQGDRHILRLNPGLAFGTGAHATTQLCLEALEMEFDQEQDSDPGLKSITVADIGCGTGILGIAALLLGAKQVYALDTDPLAVESARRSRELNQIKPEQMIILEGSFARLSQPVDGIVCNILAEVIIALIPEMTQILKPGTWAIFSGILLEQSSKVAESLEQKGWKIGSIWRKQDWCCLNAQWNH
jgi:ribosomal protein L11 methyltransferase